eukprot:PhF_6_TR21895/c0_g1_i1/m.31091
MPTVRGAFRVLGKSIAIFPLSVVAVTEGREQWESSNWVNPVWIPQEKLNNGDIVLFSRPWAVCMKEDFSLGLNSFLTKALFKSSFDHVGVVLRVANEVKILESDGRRVTISPYEDRVKKSRAKAVAVRIVQGANIGPKELKDLGEFLPNLFDKSNPTTFTDVLWASRDTVAETNYVNHLNEVCAQERYLVEVKRRPHTIGDEITPTLTRLHRATVELEQADAAAKKMWAEKEKKRKPDAIPSSGELVALCWQQLGILPAYPPAWKYISSDFSGTVPTRPGEVVLSDIIVVKNNLI